MEQPKGVRPCFISAVRFASPLFLVSWGAGLVSGCSDESQGSPGGATAGSPNGTAGAPSGGGAGSGHGAGSGNVAGGTIGGGGAGSFSTAGAPTNGGSHASEGGGSIGGGNAAGGGGAGPLGGANGTAGDAGAGGGGSGGAGSGGSAGSPDCNSVTGQKIITVAQSGGDFGSVQSALNSLSKTNSTPTQIRIAPGTYKEKLSIQIPNITLCGQAGKASSTILTYSDNANTPNGNGGTLGTTGGASTTLSSNDVSAENLTFANSTPLGGSQAVALLVTGNQVQFRNCRFVSFQDTLYVRKAKQYFRDCYVEGTVDFIFGDATAVFEDCTAHNVSGGTAVTAPNTDQSVPYGLVFLGGQLTAVSSIKAGSMALGRNWGAYGSATFLNTKLGAHISAVGWVPMGTNTLDTARFAEYKTSGAGASSLGSRAPQSKQLSDQQAANYTLEKIFGSWVPSYRK